MIRKLSLNLNNVKEVSNLSQRRLSKVEKGYIGVVRQAGRFMVCMLRCFGACAQRAGDKKNSTLEKERVGAGIGPTALGR